MPRVYSTDLRAWLIDAGETTSSAQSAARRLQASASMVGKWALRKRETGSVDAKPTHDHPLVKLQPHKHRLLRLVADEPDLTLRQIRECLAADCIHIRKSCVHTFL